jgi:RHS repeat-associated protein
MVSNITAPDNVRYEYVYTVDDERLAINTNGGNWRFTVRDLAGRVIREVNAYVGSNGTTWLWDRDHVFRDTALLATISATGTQQFHLDHLGTPRVVTDATGGQLGMHTYYPYGEELNLGPQENPEERLKFTGHERDAVGSGGLDYMHARYYAASSGRFLSVDAGRDQHPAQPQSWNLYAYALDNPMLRIDPTGRNAVIACSHNNCVVNTFVQIVRDPGDPAAVAAANGFKQNAESYWNRQHLTGPNGEQVTFNVVTTIVNPGQADHAQDTMTVVHGSGQAVVTQETEPAGKMGNPPDHGLLFTTEGTANPSGHSGVDPHEMGHFFGLGDKGPRPLPNWGSGGPTDDIMEYAQPGNSPLTAAADLFNPANRDVAILMLDLLRDMQ